MAAVEAMEPAAKVMPKARMPVDGKFSMPRTAQKTGKPTLPVTADKSETVRRRVTIRDKGDSYTITLSLVLLLPVSSSAEQHR